MSFRGRFAVTLLFATTMAYFEAAVVVYLRRLWELGALDVAVLSLSNRIVLTEVGREAASLVMIVSVAILVGRRSVERLGWVAIVFGVWDLLYYGFLRLLSDWPRSVFDWDVLFLIPRPWIGPVLAPALVSAALVTAGSVVVVREASGRPFRPGLREWLAALVGGVIVIGSFVTVSVPATPADDPEGFSWPIFLAGLLVALAGFFVAARRPAQAASGAGRSSRVEDGLLSR